MLVCTELQEYSSYSLIYSHPQKPDRKCKVTWIVFRAKFKMICGSVLKQAYTPPIKMATERWCNTLKDGKVINSESKRHTMVLPHRYCSKLYSKHTRTVVGTLSPKFFPPFTKSVDCVTACRDAKETKHIFKITKAKQRSKCIFCR